MNPMDLKRGIDLAVHAVVADIKKQGEEGQLLIRDCASRTISSNGDATVGNAAANSRRSAMRA